MLLPLVDNDNYIAEISKSNVSLLPIDSPDLLSKIDSISFTLSRYGGVRLWAKYMNCCSDDKLLKRLRIPEGVSISDNGVFTKDFITVLLRYNRTPVSIDKGLSNTIIQALNFEHFNKTGSNFTIFCNNSIEYDRNIFGVVSSDRILYREIHMELSDIGVNINKGVLIKGNHIFDVLPYVNYSFNILYSQKQQGVVLRLGCLDDILLSDADSISKQLRELSAVEKRRLLLRR